MYLYSLGVYGEIVDVTLPMDDNVSLLWMSRHGLKFISCLKVIFVLGRSHLKHVLCLQGIISKGFAFVKFNNNTNARITQLCMNNVGFSGMLE
jgi:hypothetical protein